MAKPFRKKTPNASPRLAYAIDKVSKHALADLVLDRIRIELGEDASDEDIARQLRQWFGPIWRLRNDKPVQFEAHLKTFDGYADKARERAEHAAALRTTAEKLMQQNNDLDRHLPADYEPEAFPGPPHTGDPGPRREIPATKMPRN